MSTTQFNKNKFITIVNSLEYVESVKQDFPNFKITFIDNLKLNVYIAFDGYNKFYTYLDNDVDSHTQLKYFYINKMHHINYKDLYSEIERMSTNETRVTICKSRYLKAF